MFGIEGTVWVRRPHLLQLSLELEHRDPRWLTYICRFSGSSWAYLGGLPEEILWWQQSKQFTGVISLGSGVPLQDSAVEILSAILLIPRCSPVSVETGICAAINASRRASLEPLRGLAPAETIICCLQAWHFKNLHCGLPTSVPFQSA